MYPEDLIFELKTIGWSGPGVDPLRTLDDRWPAGRKH